MNFFSAEVKTFHCEKLHSIRSRYMIRITYTKYQTVNSSKYICTSLERKRECVFI
jgi:hypothetical protein